MSEVLEQKFFEKLAKDRNITLDSAVDIFNDCVKKMSIKFNLEYTIIHQIITSSKFLKKIIIDKPNGCSKLDIKECTTKYKNECFYIGGDDPIGCIDKKFPDSEEINKDPDKYIKNNYGKTDDLIRAVRIASFLYFNYDGGGLTDNSFDAMEYTLRKRMKAKQRVYEKIGAEPVEKIKTDLPFPMPSLQKVKPGTKKLYDFLGVISENNNSKSITFCDKLDGVSAMIYYLNGNPKKMFTRGNGQIGGDISYLLDYLSEKNIPNLKKNFKNFGLKTPKYFYIRGELVLSKKIWDEKYNVTDIPNKFKSGYSNPRSFVSAKVNTGYVCSSFPDIDFVAYEIIFSSSYEHKMKYPKSLNLISNLKFNVVWNKTLSLKDVNTFDIIEMYKQRRLESEYSIDGLVLTKNNKSSPSEKIAFKMVLEEQIRETTILDIEWNISRHGRYNPVAIYNSVYIDGVRLHRATAHNSKKVSDWSLGKGTKIKVIRSGDVIPQIFDVEVDKKIPPIFPKISEYPDSCNGSQKGNHDYSYEWKGSFIFLKIIPDNPEVLVKRMLHFFEVIEVPRFGESTCRKFYNSGWKYPEQIVRLDIKDMMKLKGIGKKTAELFYSEIRKRLSIVPPDRFAVASSTFKSGIGQKIMKVLFRNVPDILNFEKYSTPQQIIDLLKKNKIPGIGPQRMITISESIPKFRDYISIFPEDIIKKNISNFIIKTKKLKKTGKYNKKIYNKSFVTTGFMSNFNRDIEDWIYENMGELSSSVTSSTEAVIANEMSVSEMSSKITKAFELGVKVYTLFEFKEKYNYNLSN